MIVRADIYRDSILYYHYICSKKLTGAYPQVSLPNPMGSPKFPEKVHWDTKNNFGNCGIYVYLHDPLDLPNDCLGLTKEKLMVTSPKTLRILHTTAAICWSWDCDKTYRVSQKKQNWPLCALWAQHIVYGELTEERTKEKNIKSWSCMMKSTTTTVVSKDSSLVVYTTTNIQSVSYY